MENPRAVAANIRVALIRADKRQDDIAAHLGLPKASVSGRMNGHIDWRLGELRKVAELLEVPLADLIADHAEPEAATA